MKKYFFWSVWTFLILGITIVLPNIAKAETLPVVSDTSVKVIGVYNKAGGLTNFVDLGSTPLNAVIAAEPTSYPTVYSINALNSVWDNGTGNYFTNTGAEWIWETAHAEDPASVYLSSNPLYDADASRNGRAIKFEKTFNIAGVPQGATLHIAADNGWEVWVNGNPLGRSTTATAGWETSNLHEASLTTSGWQSVGNISVPASALHSGQNTITVLAGNEYYDTDDGNSQVPAYVANPYRQMNPGAVIFKMDVDYTPISGCTLTQGYWKNHASQSKHPDDAWDGLDTTNFFSSGQTYLQVLQTPPKGGNAYYQLAHQFIAAKLNILNGASATVAVNTAMTGAEAWFNSPANTLKSVVLGWASTLGSYNEGLIGPGHCDEQVVLPTLN